jgi:hypothetical protein
LFDTVNSPYGAKMLFYVVKLKPGISFDDIEMSIGELCNTVKNTYGNDQGGFIAGQVFKYSGFVSEVGSVGSSNAAGEQQQDYVAIVTYWHSFEQHETSHADETFKSKFKALAEYCDDTYEMGYDMLWQGMADH